LRSRGIRALRQHCGGRSGIWRAAQRAVTLAMFSRRRLAPTEVLPSLGAQFAGAVLAALGIVALLGRSAGTVGRVGAQSPAPGVPLCRVSRWRRRRRFCLCWRSAPPPRIHARRAAGRRWRLGWRSPLASRSSTRSPARG
jgi:hypothetical protein